MTSGVVRALPDLWGVTADEVAREYPADALIPDGHRVLRGVPCAAESTVLYRRVCHLRHAPYSYDWLDNLGRRSPRQLIVDSETLTQRQVMMTIFVLHSFSRGRQLTLRIRPGAPTALFGDVAVTYQTQPAGVGHSRLVAAVRFGAPDGVLGAAYLRALAWGDLLMMRKQLRTLARLAEADARL